MNEPKRFVGLDVHKAKTVACVLDDQGEVVHRTTLQTTRPALETFGKTVLAPSDHVVLESTTNSYAVLQALRPYVSYVTIANARQVRAIAEARIKTDSIDAETLARLLHAGFIPEVWMPDETTIRLRQITSRRSSLVSSRTALKNRIHSYLAQDLIEAPKVDLFGKSGLEWLRETEFPEQVRIFVDSDLRLLEPLDRELAVLEKMLVDIGYKDHRLKLLMTMPGVSLLSGIGLLAAIGDVSRFRQPEKMASYIGLIPSTRQSANKCYHGPITKQGNTYARWLMIQAAQHCANHPGPLGVFYRRLAKKKNHNVAVVATARKMVCIAWHMLTKEEPYHYAIPQATDTKLSKLRIMATGERRPSGTPKGTPKSTGEPRRIIPSLETVYEKEGLPKPRPIDELPEGEKGALRSARIMGDMRELRQSKRVARRSEAKSKGVDESPSESQ